MATARDVVEAALREIGVLAEGETASASQASEALVRLNRFIDRLATQKLTIYTRTRSTFVLSGLNAYTVGPGGDVAIARPVFIDDVRYQDTNTTPATEYPLTKFTEDGWAALTLKELTGPLPQAWYYNPTYPLGSLSLWPIAPLTGSNLEGAVYHWTAVTQLSTLDTAVSLPPAYEEMLVTNLAKLLCPSYERRASPELLEAARDSLADLKRANRREIDMSFEAAALMGRGRGGYDIQTG